MSPLKLKIILHYHVSAEDYDREFPIKDQTIYELIEEGLLEEVMPTHERPAKFVMTERGHFYCHLLKTTPLPEQVWIDPRTNKPINRV